MSDNSAAEQKNSALEATLSQYDSSNPDAARHMRSEQEARQELARTRARLEEYEKTYGQSSSGSDSLSLLMQEKEKALTALHAKYDQEVKVRL